jgi:dsDNA-binding SOS-regulon protein
VLDKVKELLMKAPILVPPTDGEPLLLYIAATTQVVSTALMVQREEEGHALKVQCPMYFVSEVLSDSKTHYPQIQKLLYIILIAKRNLCHYIKSHPMTVVTSFALSEVSRIWTSQGESRSGRSS